MSTYELFIALRHLKSRRTRFVSTITVIAILGVFLGVMALTSVVAVTGGFQRAFQERVLGINSHVLVIKYGSDFHNYREVQDKLEKLKGTKGTSPFILHEMIATSDGKTSGVLVKGIEPSTLAKVSDLPSYIRQPGTLDELSYERFPADGKKQTPTLLLGDTLADELGVEEGDEIRITSPLQSMKPGDWSSKSEQPASQTFRVAGTYSSGFHEYDSRLVMTDYRALQDFFERGDVVTGIDIRVENVFQVGSVVDRIHRLLPTEDFRIMDWRELNHNLFTSLRLQRVVLSILFLFIVLVASFNIVCTLIMIVLDKKKEIAILKSMGATRWGIMKVFMLQGTMIGAVGTINGLLGGLGVCFLIKSMNFGLDPSIYMIDHLPVDIRPGEFALVGAVAMVISVLATVGPSWWASRLSPVEGLRYEA
ncbi:MAG: FtsX-like permease family protein [Bradymonadaceae bacterium]